MSIRDQYAAELPSWVGMKATHMPQLALDDLSPVSSTPFNNYRTYDHSLVLKCRCVSVSLLKDLQEGGAVGLYPQSETIGQQHYFSSSTYSQQQQPITATNSRSSLKFVPAPNQKPISPLDNSFKNLSYSGYYGLRVTHRLPVRLIKTRSCCSSHIPLPDNDIYAGYMSLTAEDLDDQQDENSTSTTLTILSELAFTTVFSDLVVMPVVLKKGQHYKSIGVCFMHKCIDLENLGIVEEFEIQ
ncbi:hypothetical protein BDA99DRAFT_111681 [Phascolomyces articulosus]|uniref:Uncharacterized protein n=1 Tax=Phascolomyces articulosus TaxID=60185 RepID=A0AAD5K6G8_9FUNG|nr:hypothetical protein BDA99DRAFT_111681 [Phascolomyces articulosus]